MAASLLDPAFVRKLEALRRVLVSSARSGGAGEHAARRRGSSAEFLDHRRYEPGDDPRHIDWLAFARTREAVTKLYRAEEDTLLRLVIDASASLGFGDPPKLALAQRLAAALAYLALAGGGRTEVRVARSTGNDVPLVRASPVRRGRAAFASVCQELERIQAFGGTGLAEAVRTLVAQSARPGILCLISDFFDETPVTNALGRARAAGHDVILIQVLDSAELDPDFEGDVSLEDAETNETLDVSLDAAALEAYRARLEALFTELGTWARRNGAVYVRLSTAQDPWGAIHRILGRATV